MNNYKSLVFCLLVHCCLSGTQAQSSEPRYSQEIEYKIHKVENSLAGWVQLGNSPTAWNLQSRMKFYRVKGLSIAVIHHYHLEWARGYGWADQAERRPVTVHTLFQAGSISKSLNSLGVLKLVEEGKLGLDEDINRYLKTWKFPYDSVSKGKVITLRNLLSHSGGLTAHGFPGYETTKAVPDIYQVLDGKTPSNTGPVRSMTEPGLKFIYSGGGTMISQLMVMDATGMPYARFMWENVLRPLGMASSSYQQPPDPAKTRQLATGYLWGEKEVPGKHRVYPEQAAAGLWSNPTDISKYVIETALSYRGRSFRVLSPEMSRQRVTPYLDSSAALGCFISKKGRSTYFFHTGSDVGFLSLYYGNLDNGDGVVIQINSDIAGALRFELLNSVARVYGWDGFYSPEKRETIEIPASSMAGYCGTFVRGIDTVAIHQEGGVLYYASNFMVNDHFEPLHFLTPTRFFVYEEGSTDFTMNSGADGRIKTITVKQENRPDRIFEKQGPDIKFSNRF